MEEKEGSLSGSGNSETESPAMSGGVGGGAVVPEMMSMAVNMGVEGSLGVNTGGVSVGGGSVDLLGKKKRGRPRKYDSDGNLRLSYVSPSQPLPGFSLSPSSEFSSKRGRGRPSGSGNRKLLASLGELFAHTAGGDFTPHVVTVNTGEDVAAKVLSVSQKGPRGICILSANGSVSNVTIRQPGSSGGILTFEGRFEILSLRGSFTISENSDIRNRGGGLSVSLAGPDGRVIGGGVAGLLMAASPIQMVLGSFTLNIYKAPIKRKHYHETTMAPIIQGPPAMVLPDRAPMSQADAGGNICLTSQLQVQSHGEATNSTSDKQNPNVTSSDGTDWNCPEPMAGQRPSPEIDLSLPLEQ